MAKSCFLSVKNLLNRITINLHFFLEKLAIYLIFAKKINREQILKLFVVDVKQGLTMLLRIINGQSDNKRAMPVCA